MYAIEIKNLTKCYYENKILDQFNIDIENNTVLNIAGPSGCGKTTLLRCIAGLENISSGKIRLKEKTVQSDDIFITPDKRNIGMVFQDLALWPHLTVYKNIDFVSRSIIKSRSDRKKWNLEVLEKFMINHKKNEYPGELSGGEQQRVAIARAIANKPEILLFDEPFSHLDKQLTGDIIKELEIYIKKYRATAIIVSHKKDNEYHFFTKKIVFNEKMTT